MSVKQEKRIRRHRRIKMAMVGTNDRPRLCVFRSNQHIYAQLIDDQAAKILASVWDKDIKGKEKKLDAAKKVGQAIAKIALEKKITSIVFDRGGFLFHGRVKAVAEGAREGGLTF